MLIPDTIFDYNDEISKGAWFAFIYVFLFCFLVLSFFLFFLEKIWSTC